MSMISSARKTAVVSLAVGVFGAWACQGAGTNDEDAGSKDGASMNLGADAGPITPVVVLGSGDTQFEEVSNDQTLHYIRGPQGGWHFLVSMRVQGIDVGNVDDRSDPRNPETAFQAFQQMTRIDVDNAKYRQGLKPIDGRPGWYGMVGRIVVLDIHDNQELTGKTVRLTVSVKAADGTTLTDERIVVAAPHPNNG